MLIPFHQLSPLSKLWVYQANRIFTHVQKETIEAEAKAFCEQWQAHGHPLKASFKLEHDLFLVLAVDETMTGASGCSIDGSVRMLKQLQAHLGIDFFDRSAIAFMVDGKIKLYKLAELKSLFAAGILTGQSLAFNNAVSSKADFETGWLMPISQGWLSRYLQKKELA